MQFEESSISSEFEEELGVACAVLLHSSAPKKRLWVHKLNLKRKERGEFNNLVKELEDHPNRYEMYFRMYKEKFVFVHELIKDDIACRNTQMRESISTEEKLAVCLRFLATGNSFKTLGFGYRLGFSTVGSIVRNVCAAIWTRLGPIVMPEPNEMAWKVSAEKFQKLWQFPNCIAAIDGKHIALKCPSRAGSKYYNYKGFHSQVLLALVDTEYKFIAVDVGAYGRNSDSSVFASSAMGKKLRNGSLQIPGGTPLEENGVSMPHVIVGDEAFPLATYLMRPYSRQHLRGDEEKKIFNYRLSRARRVVENAFGILASRWRVFYRPLEVQPETADKVVLAACCLHNMLCENRAMVAETEELCPENSAMRNFQGRGRNAAREAIGVREQYRQYFNSPAGQVSWQLSMIRRGQADHQD